MKPLSNKDLIIWLKQNSSGDYRPSADAAELLGAALYVIQGFMDALPTNRDWLDPDVESLARKILNR